jgi:TRAP-type mannitol/chloroaromatic compound transport system substrate-binding protein
MLMIVCLSISLSIVLLPFTALSEDLPTINWRYQVAYPPGDHDADVAVPALIKYVSEKTNGKFKIKRYYDGEIMSGDQILTGVGSGLAELGEAPGHYWGGIDKVFELAGGLPGSGRGPIGDLYAFQTGSKWTILLSKKLAEHNTTLVGWHEYGPYPLFFSNKPVRRLTDWKGVKIRVSGYSAKLLQAFGASTTYIPGAEIAQALTTGAIDAGTWTAEGINDMGFGSVMDYLILPPFIEHVGGMLIANNDAWAKLPEKYKKVLKEAEIIRHLDGHKYWQKIMEKNIKQATGVGKGPFAYEVIRLPQQDVEKINKMTQSVVWDEWAKESPACAEAIEYLKEWYKNYRN